MEDEITFRGEAVGKKAAELYVASYCEAECIHSANGASAFYYYPDFYHHVHLYNAEAALLDCAADSFSCELHRRVERSDALIGLRSALTELQNEHKGGIIISKGNDVPAGAFLVDVNYLARQMEREESIMKDTCLSLNSQRQSGEN